MKHHQAVTIVALVVAFVPVALAGPGAGSTDPVPAAGPTIDIADVDLFYGIYDDAGGRPTARQLQQDYIDKGSDGLRQFAKIRNITGARIADTLGRNPQLYSDAKQCMTTLPRVRERLVSALRRLGELYPQARFPAVTIAVGRGKPVGVGSPATGVQIGLEALCAAHWLNPNVEDRFVNVIAHEFAHVQQRPELVDADQHPGKLTVLEGSLMEGAAEFVGELISGVANARFKGSTGGPGREIETQFVADQDKTDLADWLYNGTAEEPRDLGYWVGYRISKSYYQHASDKREAVGEILEMKDPKGFLEKSGWYPGIELR
jgi:hypothetical protein